MSQIIVVSFITLLSFIENLRSATNRILQSDNRTLLKKLDCKWISRYLFLMVCFTGSLINTTKHVITQYILSRVSWS